MVRKLAPIFFASPYLFLAVFDRSQLPSGVVPNKAFLKGENHGSEICNYQNQK